jgi:hypothetical protein
MEKICKYCGKSYPLEFFATYHPTGESIQHVDYCKDCKGTHRKKYIKEYMKNYNSNPINKERRNHRKKTRLKEDSEFSKKDKERRKKWYLNKKSNFVHLWWADITLKKHQGKGYTFDIAAEDLASLAKNTPNCPICGCTFVWGSSKYNEYAPTLDRVDNEKKHISRIDILCHKCNTSKGNRNIKELNDWCYQAISYIQKKGGTKQISKE